MRYLRGEVYFQVTYPEIEMLYPKIETFVFVGKNISPEDLEDIWYFQIADAYAKYGSVVESNRGDRKVVGLTGRELTEMFDLKTLTSKLKTAAARRQRLAKRGKGQKKS